MKRTYCLYHDSCMDGFASAVVVYDRYYDDIQSKKADIVFIPVRYNEPLPEMDADADVMIVDFAYPAETLIELSRKHPYVCVIDHHESNTAELAMERYAKAGLKTSLVEDDGLLVNDTLFIRFGKQHSGCVMTYHHFHGSDNGVPALLAYVEDRDLWKFELNESQNMTAVIQSWAFELDFWRDRMNHWQQLRMECDAEAVVRARRKIIGLQLQARHFVSLDPKAGRIFTMPMRDYTVEEMADLIPAVNATAYVSETCHSLIGIYPEAKYVVAYRKKANLDTEWSLRTHHKDVDVSLIAKAMGGGGHKAAAGFTTPAQPNNN